jgi:predicted deacylase
VAQRASGEELGVTVHVARGAADGPTLGLVATIHGDAAFGALAIKQVLDSLDLAALRGRVVAVPIANPVAFESFTRTTGQGMNTDMNNMNRVFPGDPNGWMTQRLAAVVAEYVVPEADAFIDFHCGADSVIDYTLVSGDRTESEIRNLEYARRFGTPYMFIHDKDPHANTLDGYVKSLGKLSIVAEQGGTSITPEFTARTAERTRNVMKALGMLDGDPVLPASQLVMRRRVLVRVDTGGMIVPEVGPEAAGEVPEGTVLSRVIDPHTLEVAQVFTAPYRRSVLLDVRTGVTRVNPGDYGYIIADGDSGTETPFPVEQWGLAL